MIRTPGKAPRGSHPHASGSDFFDTDHLQGDLKGRSVRGGAWTVFSQGCKFVLKLGGTITLARLLTPGDFGLVAMVTAVTNFATMFKDLGLSTATIQKKRITHEQVSALFWVNCGAGMVIALCIAVLGPAVARYYSDPRLTAITVSLGATFVFVGITAQHQALLRRRMRFVKLGVVEITASGLSVFAAIIAAGAGIGYWALVVMHITLAAARAAGMWLAVPWRPGVPRRGTGVRSMLRLGRNITGFNLLNYFARNADNLLIGRFLGPAALGFYSKAYGLMLLPIRQLNVPLSAVSLPALSRLRDTPAQYRNFYLRMVRMVALAVMPAGALVAVLGDTIVTVLLGPQWETSADLLRLFGIVMLAQPVVNPLGLLYISQGRSGEYVVWGMISTLLTVGSILLGLRWGVAGVAACYSLTALLLRAPLAVWFACRKGPVTLKHLLEGILPVGIMSFAVASLAYASRAYLNTGSPTVELAVGLALFLAVLLSFVHVVPSGRKLLAETKDVVRHLAMGKKKGSRP